MLDFIANGLSEFVRQHPLLTLAYFAFTGIRSFMRNLASVEDGSARLLSSPHRTWMHFRRLKAKADRAHVHN